MREYNNYPRENEIVEVKKPKLYIVTSKIVNLLAVFVASISVSTFFATRYIGIGDTFFSANAFSTMLAMALLIVILETYGKKNAIKAFMAGAYAILLIFFISAFIPDFNPLPIGYYESSFINFHQKILLCVFISYVIAFLVCIRIYLYMKNELNIPYLWVKAIPAIVISQLFYTICYYLIYHGFNNLEYASTDIRNELYLKSFMLIIDILIIYFIISGMKSGFFDLTKNIFSYNSKNNYYDDYNPSSEYRSIKNVITEDDDRMGLPYNKRVYLEDYSKKRSKRYLPDYSEEENYDSRKISRGYSQDSRNYPQDNNRGFPNNYYENETLRSDEYNQREAEDFRRIEREAPVSSRRSSRRALNRREASLSRRERSNLNSNPNNDFISNESNITRSRSSNRSNQSRSVGNNPFGQNQLSNQPLRNNFPANYGSTPNLGNSGLSNLKPNFGKSPFEANSGGRITPRSSQSFFVNALTPNKMNNSFNGINNSSSGFSSNFGNMMNKNNNWRR